MLGSIPPPEPAKRYSRKADEWNGKPPSPFCWLARIADDFLCALAEENETYAGYCEGEAEQAAHKLGEPWRPVMGQRREDADIDGQKPHR